MTDSRGIFITFEGGEGSGKSTQVLRLAETLRAKGYEVVLTREPGGTPEAEKIRSLLVERDGGSWSPIEECLLLFAARSNHIRTLIEPALEGGKVVICDRFTDSTRAYQGYGLGLELEHIETLNRTVLNSYDPDLTFLLDIPAREGLKRSNKRLEAEGSTEDKYEGLDIEFHENLRQGFLTLSDIYEDRFCVIDARQSIDDLSKEIAAKALEALS